jgi:hypothetical protein
MIKNGFKKYFDIRSLKKKFSHLESDEGNNILNKYTYYFARDFFRNLSIHIEFERNNGVKDSSLDLEMLALKMIAELYQGKCHYASDEVNLSSKLINLDQISKKIVLKALEYDVKSVDGLLNYPYLEELLDAFMLAEVDLKEVMINIEMGEL